MRYFILDDDLTFCLQLQEMLEGAAAEDVQFAHDVDQALEHMHAASRAETLPDVILCDYGLANGATGFDFLEAIQNEGFDVPAVLLTDFDDREVIQRAAEQFSVVHIGKTGLETAELVQQISFFAFRRWAEQRRLASQQVRRQASNMLLVGAEIAHEFKDVIRATRAQFNRLRRAAERDTLSQTFLERLIDQLDEALEDGIRLSDMLMRYGGEIQGHELKLERADLTVEIEAAVHQPEFSPLRVTIDAEADCKAATVDRFVLRRVLSVLLSNIVDHARGATEVHVAIGETTREGGRALYIDIEDNGPGIPAEHRRSIFEAGERGGKQIQYTGLGGLGLGLGFAKTLIGLHVTGNSRGTIHCLDGTLGTGARFRISLPQE